MWPTLSILGILHERGESLYSEVLKTLKKKLMLKNVGMAVPKTTATRCRDGSVQARHVIQRLHKYPIFLI